MSNINKQPQPQPHNNHSNSKLTHLLQLTHNKNNSLIPSSSLFNIIYLSHFIPLNSNKKETEQAPETITIITLTRKHDTSPATMLKVTKKTSNSPLKSASKSLVKQIIKITAKQPTNSLAKQLASTPAAHESSTKAITRATAAKEDQGNTLKNSRKDNKDKDKPPAMSHLQGKASWPRFNRLKLWKFSKSISYLKASFKPARFKMGKTRTLHCYNIQPDIMNGKFPLDGRHISDWCISQLLVYCTANNISKAKLYKTWGATFTTKGGIHTNRPLMGSPATNFKGTKFTCINSYTLMGKIHCEHKLAKVKKSNEHIIKWATCFWVKKSSKQCYKLNLYKTYLPEQGDLITPILIDYKQSPAIPFTDNNTKKAELW